MGETTAELQKKQNQDKARNSNMGKRKYRAASPKISETYFYTFLEATP
jgi:hypothetical protein